MEVKSTKTVWDPSLGQRDQSRAQNLVFCHFLMFGSLVFLDIEYNDNLKECIISSRGKIHEKKNLGPKFVPKGPKSGLKLGFLIFSQVLLISFP